MHASCSTSFDALKLAAPGIDASLDRTDSEELYFSSQTTVEVDRGYSPLDLVEREEACLGTII